MTFGQEVLAGRVAKNMTQDQLAEKMGLKRSTISHWELEQSMPTFLMAIRVAKELGFSTDDITPNRGHVAPGGNRKMKHALRVENGLA